MKPKAQLKTVLIRPKEAANMLGISRSTLYTWIGSGYLPVRPVQLGARATAFRLDELQAWIEGRSRTTPHNYAATI